ncbi:MAG TPA: hypothetical protein VJ063_20405 [Verrucomicrobiae bacterium]|nr:hypothetical protein [Verrucomicrobiae bacterium]
MKIRAQSNRQGHTVILTLVVCLVLGIVLLGIIKLANTEGQMTGRSQNWNNALPIAEAGIEEALTHLKYSPSNRSANGWALVDGRYTRTRAFKDGSYTVTISGDYNPIIRSTAWMRAPGQKDYSVHRQILVKATNQPMFTAALEAPVAVILKGNGTHIDSYDSRDPLHSTSTGAYDPKRPKDGGDVICYGGSGSLDIGNGDIDGKIKTGPDTTYSVGANGSVGSLTWGGGGVQPGWVEEAPETEYPMVAAPTGGAKPAVGSGVNKNYQWVISAPGLSEVPSINGSVLVTASNVTLVVRNTLSMAPKDSLDIKAGASLTLIVDAADVSLSGVANATTDALKFQYYGTQNNVSISMGGNAEFIGVLYAPNAILNLNGGGSGSAVDFSGAIIAKQVKVNGHYNFHFDEATRRFGSRGIVAASWDELSPDDKL